MAMCERAANAEQPDSSAPVHAASVDAEPDWNQLDAEALGYFRRYLQFDTSNPPGDTGAAIAFLREILDREGIATETFASQPGKVNLIARIPGSGNEKPLLLMSHADVVPADAAKWSHPPFRADLADGYVWARGSIDDKSHGIMALMTMIALKRNKIPLRRGLEIMINADEEVGGHLGAAWMIANHWQSIDPAFAINEGGGGRLNYLGSNGVTFAVAVAEKRVMWLRLTAHGKAGHGSEPNADNPNLILINALSRLLEVEPPMRVIPIFNQAMKAIALRTSFPDSFELAHLELRFVMSAALGGPLADYMVQALMRDTIAPTMLNSGLKVNVIPSTAEATLDCRLLPDSDPEAFLQRMRRLIDDPRISIEFIQRPDMAPPSPVEGEAWKAIEDIVNRDFTDSIAVPSLTAGGTDSRFIRLKNVPAYGFVPIVLDRQESGRIHGVDERLSVENLNRGIRATYDLAIELCGPHPAH
jgi:acetylornithine deacetylase/succinyl-diaminopimelate desuccinylase-like protein